MYDILGVGDNICSVPPPVDYYFYHTDLDIKKTEHTETDQDEYKSIIYEQ